MVLRDTRPKYVTYINDRTVLEYLKPLFKEADNTVIFVLDDMYNSATDELPESDSIVETKQGKFIIKSNVKDKYDIKTVV